MIKIQFQTLLPWSSQEFLVIWRNRSAEDPYLIKENNFLRRYAFKIYNFISTGTLLYTYIKKKISAEDQKRKVSTSHLITETGENAPLTAGLLKDVISLAGQESHVQALKPPISDQSDETLCGQTFPWEFARIWACKAVPWLQVLICVRGRNWTGGVKTRENS